MRKYDTITADAILEKDLIAIKGDILKVTFVDLVEDGVLVKGVSEISGDTETYTVPDETSIDLLGA